MISSPPLFPLKTETLQFGLLRLEHFSVGRDLWDLCRNFLFAEVSGKVNQNAEQSEFGRILICKKNQNSDSFTNMVDILADFWSTQIENLRIYDQLKRGALSFPGELLVFQSG